MAAGRRRRKETLDRRARFKSSRYCWRCGDELKGRDRGKRNCTKCRHKRVLEHELWLSLLTTGPRRDIDFSDAPIAKAFRGWRRLPLAKAAGGCSRQVLGRNAYRFKFRKRRGHRARR